MQIPITVSHVLIIILIVKFHEKYIFTMQNKYFVSFFWPTNQLDGLVVNGTSFQHLMKVPYTLVPFGSGTDIYVYVCVCVYVCRCVFNAGFQVALKFLKNPIFIRPP